MKKIHKLFALALALTLALSLSLPAMAVPATDGTITINNTVKGQSYSVYRLLDLETFDPTIGDGENADAIKDNAHFYKVNTAWTAFFAQPEISGASGYVTIDTSGYVTWNTGNSPADFAAEALEWATTMVDASGIPAVKDQNGEWPVGSHERITPTVGPVEATESTVNFTSLTLGYYLVKSSLGGLCSLDTTNKNAVVIEKNEKSTVTKTVNGKEVTDANIGDELTFVVTVKVNDGEPKDYKIIDTMGAGLTFVENSLEVKFNDGNAISEGVPTDNVTKGWTFINRHNDADQIFSIQFYNLKVNDTITVTYKAFLNDQAFVGGINDANKNKVDLDTEGEDDHDETDTKTWKFDVHKYGTTDKATSIDLSGVQFKLTESDAADSVGLDFVGTAGAYKRCTKTSCADHQHTKVLVTDTDGKIALGGLVSGTYYLHETQPLPGYNNLTAPIKVVIAADGSVTFNDAEEATTNKTIEVENKSGTELPETGGMGTTIFYVAGAVLMLGAVILLVTKKKMQNR